MSNQIDQMTQKLIVKLFSTVKGGASYCVYFIDVEVKEAESYSYDTQTKQIRRQVINVVLTDFIPL